MEISAYRLTIIAAVVVLVLSVGIVTVLGGPVNAAAYLGLVGTIAIPGLFQLWKLEQTAKNTAEMHAVNRVEISQTNDKIDALASTLEKKGAP